jgi:hypothetical protein
MRDPSAEEKKIKVADGWTWGWQVVFDTRQEALDFAAERESTVVEHKVFKRGGTPGFYIVGSRPISSPNNEE